MDALPLLIKPHHFLDIIKLYGAGYEEFIPDKKYGHDFWRVGNEILRNPDVRLQLTIDNDAICAPCKFSNGKSCIDSTTIERGEIPKDKWNRIIDKRLLEILGKKEGTVLTASEFCRLVQVKITKEDVLAVWKEKPQKETEKRVQLLLASIEKYISVHR